MTAYLVFNYKICNKLTDIAANDVLNPINVSEEIYLKSESRRGVRFTFLNSSRIEP